MASRIRYNCIPYAHGCAAAAAIALNFLLKRKGLTQQVMLYLQHTIIHFLILGLLSFASFLCQARCAIRPLRARYSTTPAADRSINRYK